MKILVTGATGSVGRLVVDRLLDAGAEDVRALTNDRRRAARPAGVEVVDGYLRRPESLPPAFAGVDRMYLAPAPETAAETMRIARAAGVRHVVDLSGEHESWWGDVTRAVEQSGIAWTHLWAGEFLENDLVWAEQIRRTGRVRDPFPDVVSAPIAMDDIARVAAACLLGDGHEGRTYELTGPRALSRAERLHAVGVAIGVAIDVVPESLDEAVARLEPTMGDSARWYVEEAIGSLRDAPQAATGTVAEVTGAPATDVVEWAAAHSAEFLADNTESD